MVVSAWLRAFACVFFLGGCFGSTDEPASVLAKVDFVQWKLPKELAEISGLALDGNDRLFGHDDEHGVIHEIDYRAGKLVKSFALGAPTIRDDFEGIAIAGADFYLITSDGTLYRTTEGADGAHVAYTTTETGLADRCEAEGLAYDAHRRVLLIACKNSHGELDGQVAVFAWSVTEARLDPAAMLNLAETALAGPISTAHFNPSSIELGRGPGHVLLLAGRQRALAEVSLLGGGMVISVVRLPRGRHRQPEGLALTRSGDLIVADEAEKGRARLAVYGVE